MKGDGQTVISPGLRDDSTGDCWVNCTGEAHRHVDAAREGGLDQRRTHLLLADIAEAEGNEPAQRDALRSAAMASPDPAWRCEACGTALGGWHPACPACHTAGRVRWGVAGPMPGVVPVQRIAFDGVE